MTIDNKNDDLNQLMSKELESLDIQANDTFAKLTVENLIVPQTAAEDQTSSSDDLEAAFDIDEEDFEMLSMDNLIVPSACDEDSSTEPCEPKNQLPANLNDSKIPSEPNAITNEDLSNEVDEEAVVEEPVAQSNEIDDELKLAMLAAFGDEAFDMLAEEAESEESDFDLEALANPRDFSNSDSSSRKEWMTQLCESLYVKNANNSNKNSTKRAMVFLVGETQFAIPVEGIREIAQQPKVTPIPRAPSWLSGVANFRGTVLSVIDLRNLLHIENVQPTVGQKVIVVNDKKLDCQAAVSVDRVLGIREIDPDLELPCDFESETFSIASGMTSVQDHDVVLIDIQKLFSKANVGLESS